MTRAAALLFAFTAACSSAAPAPDPIGDIIRATPAGEIKLFAFKSAVIIANKMQDLNACTVVLDDALRGQIATIRVGDAVTVNRDGFMPTLPEAEFYRRALKDKRLECIAARGPVVVRFAGGAPEQTVFIPKH